MDSAIALQEFLEYVVANLIDHPDQASILHDLEGDTHVFRVVLAKGDTGRVIGKQGGTIRSIRNLLEAACIKQGVRASVDVGTREEFGLSPLSDSE
jgi:predicted RNA-binding protein YlqC (UPF0109 family)